MRPRSIQTTLLPARIVTGQSDGRRISPFCCVNLCPVATVPSMSNAQLVGGGSHGHPGDDAGTGANRPVERQRNRTSDDSPMDVLTPLSAMVVSQRVRFLRSLRRATAPSCSRYCVCGHAGLRAGQLGGAGVSEVFHTVPAALSAIPGVDALANLVVELHTVRVGQCGPG